MQKPPTKSNTEAKISNSITPWFIDFSSLNFQSKHGIRCNSCTSLRALPLVATFLPQLNARFWSGRQADLQLEEAGPAVPFPGHLQRRHLSNSAVSQFKELKSQPRNPTENVVSWPLVWLPEPTHPKVTAAEVLAWGRRGNASAGGVSATLLEAVRPTLAATLPHLWHLHKNWPHVQLLSSKQGRTQKNPIHGVHSKAAQLP